MSYTRPIQLVMVLQKMINVGHNSSGTNFVKRKLWFKSSFTPFVCTVCVMTNKLILLSIPVVNSEWPFSLGEKKLKKQSYAKSKGEILVFFFRWRTCRSMKPTVRTNLALRACGDSALTVPSSRSDLLPLLCASSSRMDSVYNFTLVFAFRSARKSWSINWVWTPTSLSLCKESPSTSCCSRSEVEIVNSE